MKEYLKAEADIKDPDLISAIDELPLWSAPFGLKLLDIIEYKKNIRVLDIGCGMGFPLLELGQRLGDTCQLHGIDPWEEALDRARFKLQVYNIKNVKLVNIAAENLPFDDKYFDLIISNNGINNVQDIVQTMKECFRVSRPEAQMVFSLNTPDTMKEFYSIFQEVLQEEGLENEVREMESQIYSKRRPLNELIEITKNSGFKIVNLFEDTFTMKFADGSAMLNHCLIKYWFMDGWKKILNESNMNEVFENVEEKLNQQSDSQGYFTLTIPFVTFDCRRTA